VFVKKELLIVEASKCTSTHEKIKLKVRVGQIDFVLLIYYRQPIQQSLAPFMIDVEDELQKENGNIIIVGDVNLDARGDNAHSMKYINMLKSYNMIITNNMSTRNISGRVIDHFCTNFIDPATINNNTITNSLSDHNIILSILNNIKSSVNKTTLKFSSTNYECLREEFSKVLPEELILNIKDSNLIAERLTKATMDAINKSTRTLKFTLKGSEKICDWYTLKVVRAIKKKDQLINKFKRNTNNQYLKLRVKMTSKRIKTLIRT
jgi:hypothetical protein